MRIGLDKSKDPLAPYDTVTNKRTLTVKDGLKICKIVSWNL